MADWQEIAGLLKVLGFFLSAGIVVILPFRIVIPYIWVTVTITIVLVALVWILWVGALAVSQASWGGFGDTTGIAMIGTLCMILAGGVAEAISRAYSRVYDKLAANKPSHSSPDRPETK